MAASSPLDESSGLIDLVVSRVAAVEQIDLHINRSAVLVDEHRMRTYPLKLERRPRVGLP